MAKPQKNTASTPEAIWAILREIAQSQKETDRLIKENKREMEEAKLEIKETFRQLKISDKKFGELNNRFGEIVEYMIAPNLCKKFRELGLNFQKSTNRTAVDDFDNDIHFEIDVMLENGEKAMLVEVKTTFTTEQVKEHIKRLEIMRKYSDLRGDKRSFLGAVAGVVIRPNVKKYALEQGFFVVEPSGETFNITSPQGQPKEW